MKRLVINVVSFCVGLGFVVLMMSCGPVQAAPPTPAPITVYVPYWEDPAWMPVWEKGAYVALKAFAIWVIVGFLGRLA